MIINNLVNRINANDNKESVLKLKSYEVVDADEVGLDELVNITSSQSFTINLTFSREDKNGDFDEFTSTISIPKMINGVFVVNGKVRLSTNIMVSSGECRVYPDNIVINSGNLTIDWKYPPGVDQSVYQPHLFMIHTHDLDWNEIDFPGLPENYEIYKDFLVLTENQRKKLMIKLQRTDIPTHLTPELVQWLWEFGSDTKKDLIIDKTIANVETDFLRYLNAWENRKKIYVGASSYYWKYREVKLTALQTAITSYFAAAKSSCIEIPSKINPLIYDSIRGKLSIPPSVAYNATFADLIDAPNTPENNNVNILNELNVCASIEDNEIYYTCYDFKTGKKVKLKYIDYLTKKVLKCDFYDYKNHKPKDLPQYKYRQFLQDNVISSLDEVDIDLVEPSPDERLSVTTRRIPMVNMSDSVRVAMGCAMLKQSIQTTGCEPRLVDSGNDEDWENSASLTHYSGINEGEVLEVTDTYIIIKDKVTNAIMPVSIPEPIIGMNDSMMTSKSTVKVGDTVIPGQIVASPKTLSNGTYDFGINAHAVYMSYLGMTYEDGVVVSESYAKKATHHSSILVTQSVKFSDAIQGIIPIGSRVRSGDKLVDMSIKPINSQEVEDLQTQGKGNQSIFKAIKLTEKGVGINVPNNIDEGYVTDVKIILSPLKTNNFDQATMRVINEYMTNPPKVDDYSVLPSDMKNLKAPDNYEFSTEDAIIMIRIVRVNRMKIGDKSSNSWGGKGIISLIVPDELMPRLNLDGKGNGPAFDIIMNPGAVVGRKNPSQLYECVLTKCIHAIYDKVNHFIEDDDADFNDIRPFLHKFYGNKFDNYSDDELIEASRNISNFSMKVGSYANFTYDQVLGWMKDLDVKEDDKIYVPSVCIYQDSSYENGDRGGTRVCSPKYAREHGIQGKIYRLGFVNEPVVTGWSYMYKLYHAPEYSGKVTPADSKASAPLLKYGNYRTQGQKIGEMEYWGLLSHNRTEFVTENNPDIRLNENVFINELLLTGLAVMDQMNLPFNLPGRKKIAKIMKDKYNISE